MYIHVNMMIYVSHYIVPSSLFVDTSFVTLFMDLYGQWFHLQPCSTNVLMDSWTHQCLDKSDTNHQSQNFMSHKSTNPKNQKDPVPTISTNHILHHHFHPFFRETFSSADSPYGWSTEALDLAKEIGLTWTEKCPPLAEVFSIFSSQWDLGLVVISMVCGD